jgi:hypothetical protein
LNKFKKFFQSSWIPIVLGLTAFILLTGGGRILWPGNINWLVGDGAESLITWQFFRYTPLFQNPLGACYPYGMGLGGSVLYGESLFIFAFPFKLLSRWLPIHFQYLGLWALLCFVLQALFSWKLLEKITKNPWLKSLGSLFFVFAPVFLFRFSGNQSFLGQWLLLAGILLYLSLHFRNALWCSLIIISSLVHPYFLMMLLAIWVADLLKRKIFYELTYQEIIKHILIVSLILLIVMWQVGYFMLQGGYEGPGLGAYRMNLLSFIDPYKEWSHILAVQPHTSGDYEGFSYLGLGIMILGIFGFAGLLKFLEKKQAKIIFLKIKKLIPLIVIALLLMIFALSNRIALGQYELVQYKLPEIFGVFRATGRMALPMYYLIYLGIFYLIVRCYKKVTAISLIFICLAIQISDISKVFIRFWQDSSLQVYHSPLKSPVWSQIAKKYKKVILTLPEPLPLDWEPLSRYAAFNRLSINEGYFARNDFETLNKNREVLRNNITQGKLDKDALYIIRDVNLRKIIAYNKTNFPYKVIKADGYFLLLPNWFESSTEAQRMDWANGVNYHPYVLGSSIFFQKPKDNFKDYVILIKGWSFPEGTGTWTEGDHSILFLQLNKKPDSDLILTIKAVPYINVKHPTLEADILVNKKMLGHLTYSIDNFSTSKQVTIPQSIISDNSRLNIEFIFKNAISPKNLQLSSDVRQLGLFISSLAVSKKEKG